MICWDRGVSVDGEQLESRLTGGIKNRVTREKNRQANSRVVTGSDGVP